MNVFASVGRATLDLLREIGRLSIFTADAVTSFVRPPIYWSLVGKQIMRIGYFSLPVVGLTAFFTGAVLALQIYIGTARYGAEQFVPTVVLIGILRELGPVIAGLMVAGRVAAAIAAELGTMRVTEQIDALTTLATRPIKYLVVPRLMAALISMPILVAIADAIGVMGGYVAATESLDFTGSIYLNTTMAALSNNDIASGLYKAVVFGFLIALMGCYNGFNSKGGAQGVGAATTNAVVSASILILVANYILTNIFNLLGI
ncbi:MlaE family ABC transporter permease [Rhizomicrobium electricum]|jgi:phospholipid/cholesterol/gamma-HCH transport system permease protein|uniref:ABC transporter permease n=1 Tax=Rhizomicrobium electricum TaxID=480070 RepID=A0ABN1FEB1_9PROT|nr:ABC transporter permease [Rhizomicrobium electricum]NIJ50833.1 phospholipid/cholesterol/gamma-HCH transport system permease protein [Rhizomicrobium electricum]